MPDLDKIPRDTILEPNERVLIASRPLFLWEPFILILVFLLGAGAAVSQTRPDVTAITLALAALLAVWLLVRWIPWRTRWFILTDRRVIARWGVLNRHQTALLLQHIQDAQLIRPFPLSMVRDYGIIHIQTAGEASALKISAGLRDLKMTRASEFYRAFSDAITPEAAPAR